MRTDRMIIEDENLSHDNMYGHAPLIITITTKPHHPEQHLKRRWDHRIFDSGNVIESRREDQRRGRRNAKEGENQAALF